jgi:malate dehydrogenase (oxaloacetate-decarboxylating)
MELKNLAWQERYRATQIYTLQCKILDKPGMFGKVADAIGAAGVNIGSTDITGVDGEYQIRNIGVFCQNKAVLDKVVSEVRNIAGVEVLGVRDEVLEIHRRGTIEMKSRIPINSLTDLRMIYTPGVAMACQEIEKNPSLAWDMTGICDRVAIVTNGTAILGLGDIGNLAGLPVMEGKAAIFAEFTGISAVPVLIDSKDPDTVVDIVAKTAKSYGAIQLEDIAAPECFEIEDRLKELLDIPVFHDDQHGTATVVLAAMINCLKKTNRKIEDCKAVMLGAGAAGYAITMALLKFGIGDIVVYDSFGPIYRGRTEKMNRYKQKLAEMTNKNNEKGTLLDGFKGKDIFIGVARPKMVSKEMIAAMNKNALVFPLSNPEGEIDVQDAIEAGAAVAADGRTINNALAYPALFRGALDVKAEDITFEMQLAAAKTLASLAKDGDLLPDVLDRNVHKITAAAVAAAWKK